MSMRRTGSRRVVAAALIVLVTLMLTACGAVIDTAMTVEADGSGARVIKLTLPADEVANINGGAEVIDRSIHKHIPDGIEYSGTQRTSGGGLEATFTIRFLGAHDYTKKVGSILAAGGVTGANIDFSVRDSTFTKAIDIDEGFTSQDLLGWMFKGLLADGVVAETESSNMYEFGRTSLEYDGQVIDQGNSIRHQAKIDDGFTGVSMETTADGEAFHRTIRLTADGGADYDRFLADAAPSGAKIEKVDSGTWTVTFTGTPDRIAAGTNSILQTDTAKLIVERATARDDPTIGLATVTSYADCANVCAMGVDSVEDTISLRGKFEPSRVVVDASLGEKADFEFAPPLEAITNRIQFGLTGGVDATTVIAVANEDVDAAGDGFTKLFKPADGTGTLAVERGDTSTRYSATFTGSGLAAFSDRYTAWAPGAQVRVSKNEGDGFFTSDLTYSIDPGVPSIARGHLVTGETATTIALPLGQTVDGTERLVDSGVIVDNRIAGATLVVTGERSLVSFRATGPTLAGAVTLAAILLASVAALVYGLGHRRRVATASAVTKAVAVAAATTAQGLARDAKDRLGERLLSTPGGLFSLPAPHAAAPPAAESVLFARAAAPASPPALAGALLRRATPPGPNLSGALVDRPRAPRSAKRPTTLTDRRATSDQPVVEFGTLLNRLSGDDEKVRRR